MEAPKRDAYGAGLGFLTLLVGILFYKADDNNEAGVPLIIGGSVVTVASYVSGGVGYFRVKRCQKAIAEFNAGQMR